MSKVAIAIMGAISFWIPVILAFAIFRIDANSVAMNIFATGSTLALYAAVRRFFGHRFIGLWILLGIYVSGPAFLNMANAFVGGGFSQSQSWSDIGWLLLFSAFPPLFLFFAGNSGILPSILVATILLGYWDVRQFGAAPKTL